MGVAFCSFGVILNYNTLIVQKQSSEDAGMLKLTPIRKWRVPNALAIVGALLLLVSTLAGVERPDGPAEAAASLAGTAIGWAVCVF